jgi:hypothetical protein
MNKTDDLKHLWKTQPLNTATKGEDMRNIVVKKIAAFDRTVRIRNRIEISAALLVAAFFAYALWVQRNGLERLGSGIIVAGALWIVYYIRRHGTSPSEPFPDQAAAAYQRALVLKYEHQIQLLRNAKFWYLLPMYVGLLISSAGLLREHAAAGALTWGDIVNPLIYTLVFTGIWWLNEIYAVRKLQRFRMQLIAGMEDQALAT